MSLHLAILLDQARAREEISAYQRLSVALAGEGVHSVIGIADGSSDEIDNLRKDAPIPEIHLPAHVPFWMRASTARLTQQLLKEANGDTDFDAILVSGNSTLDIAGRTAELMDCPLIAEVRSRDEADVISRNRHVDLAVAATEPLARRVGIKFGTDHVERIRPCLPSLSGFNPPTASFILLLGPPQDAAVWSAVLDGIIDATSELPPAERPMIAMELGDSRTDMQVWARARERDLLDRIVTVENIDQLRSLLTCATVVLIPDQGQTLRTIVPQAMHRGVIPVVAEDPDMDYLQHERTALTVQSSELQRRSAWGALVKQALQLTSAPSPSRADIVGISKEFLASEVAPQWATLIHSLLHGDTIPITDS